MQTHQIIYTSFLEIRAHEDERSCFQFNFAEHVTNLPEIPKYVELKLKKGEATSRAGSQRLLAIWSDKASVTVLAQALAWFSRSNFFLTFLRGVFLGADVCVMPGNSPCFQCVFLKGEEEGEGGGDFLAGAAKAQRTMRVLECGEGTMGEKETKP